jgi:putative ABC transport system permease protein
MRKVALRGLFARKTRLVLTALAVALGVTLIAGTYVFTDTINGSFDKIFTAAYKNTDVAVTPNDTVEADETGSVDPIPASVVARIRALPEVAAVDGSVFDQNGTILDKDGDRVSKGAPNFVASIQRIRRFESFTVAKGRMPRTADEVALDKATADRKGFEVGGTVDIVDKEPRKTYRVVGVVKVAGVDSYGGAAVALMTLAEAQRMSGKRGAFDQISVAAKRGISPEQLRTAVREVLPARFDVRTGSEEADDQTSDIKDELGFLTTALLAFAGIALFVGAFIIFNTFSITVAQRAREFGLLRTLGASRRQILSSVLTEGLVLGALGSVAGLALGVLVAKGLRTLFEAIGFDVPSQGTVLQSRTVIVSLLVGIVVTLVASLAPALRATRVPPVAALREGVTLGGRDGSRGSRLAFPLAVLLTIAGAVLLVLGLTSDDATTGLSLTGAGAAASFLGVALMSPRLVGPIAAVVGRPFRGITGRLARENSVRQPGRTAATAAALMIGVALVSFASIFAASTKATFSDYIDQGLAADLVIQHGDGFSPFSGEVAQRVKRVPGVQTVSGVRFVQFQLGGEDKGVTAVDPATFAEVYNLTKGTPVIAGLGPDEVAVKKKYAEDHDISAGQTIVVRTPRERALRLRVAGLYEDKATLLGAFTMSDAGVARHLGVSRDNYLFARFAPGADEEATQKAVDRELDRDFPQTEALTASQFKDDQAAQIDSLLALIYALLALAVIVSLFGIVNTLALSITERTREIGMLRAIGMSRRQVRSVIRKESVIIAAIGGVLGLGMGVVLSILFTQALEDIRLTVPVIPLVVLLLLAALAGVLAAALPARRASRLDVLEALAYE